MNDSFQIKFELCCSVSSQSDRSGGKKQLSRLPHFATKITLHDEMAKHKNE